LIIGLRRQLAEQGLDAGAHTIAWHLAEQHQLRVSAATIWRTLKRAGLISPEPMKKPRASYVRFTAEQPNQMWQTDFTHYRLTRPDGTPGADAEILCFLDDHSRYALSVSCHQPVTGPAVVAAFRQAVARAFPPRCWRTTAWSSPPASPAAGLAGTPSTASKPCCATSASCRSIPSRTTHHLRQGGAIPATLKKWLTAQWRQPQTLAELQGLCDTFVAYYKPLPAAPLPEPTDSVGGLSGPAQGQPANHPG
jgi:hypothetical protein